MGSMGDGYPTSKSNPWHASQFAKPESKMPVMPKDPADKRLLDALLAALSASPGKRYDAPQMEALFEKSRFPQQFARLVFILYAPGQPRIVVTRAYDRGRWRFSSLFKRLLEHPRRCGLTSGRYHLQVDFITEEPHAASIDALQRETFEPGVDGLLLVGQDGVTQLFTPGDAYVRSILTLTQFREYLHQVYGEDFLSHAHIKQFRSESFLAYHGNWLRMYRGRPLVGALTKEKIGKALRLAMANLRSHQRKDGTYLPFYDAARDSLRDPDHPARDPETNPYINVLRHAGGGLACLHYEIYGDKPPGMVSGKVVEGVRGAIEYLKAHTRYHHYKGKAAGYVYSEKKAKLGATGLALYLVAEYQLATGDHHYQPYADALAWHLVNQVTASGEFMYYHIYQDQPVTESENPTYFSFHYPGEALAGLARYLHTISDVEGLYILEKATLALEYLLHKRPTERREYYAGQPVDSWLMIAMNEFWSFEGMRQPAYSQFVFAEAERMVRHMYRVSNAPFPDYAGGFYHKLGDAPNFDGARLEGLMAAYELAARLDKKELKHLLWCAIELGAWSVMHLVNTEPALYHAKNPQQAVGGIRLKPTRQWYRTDTIHHVVSFFARVYRHWGEVERA